MEALVGAITVGSRGIWPETVEPVAPVAPEAQEVVVRVSTVGSQGTLRGNALRLRTEKEKE